MVAIIVRTVLLLTLTIASKVVVADIPRIDLVKVAKSERVLYLMSGGRVVREFPVTFGGRSTGHKQQEGDERTPEGTYILDFKKPDSRFFKSIHIDYPNAADREAARRRGVAPGGDIFIHGQRNGLGWLSFVVQHFNWTDGCIALADDDMQEVWELVRVPTPVHIAP